MEFRRATLDEQPDRVAGRAPRARDLPAAAPARPGSPRRDDFLLYDFVTRRRRRSTRTSSPTRTAPGAERSLVVYHNRFALDQRHDPRVGGLCAKARTGPKRKVRRSLAEGLGLPNDAGDFVVFRDARTGLESHPLVPGALGARPARVARRLRRPRLLGVPRGPRRGRPASGRGWRHGSASGPCRRSRTRCASSSSSRSTRRCARSSPAASVTGGARRGAKPAAARRPRDAGSPRSWPRSPTRPGCPGTRRPLAAARPRADRTAMAARRHRAASRVRPGGAARVAARCHGPASWHRAPTSARPAAPGSTSSACRRPGRGPREAGLDEGEAWAVADLVRVLLRCRARRTCTGPAGPPTPGCSSAGSASDVVRAAIGVNTWEGVEWLDRDRFAAQLGWARRLDAIEASPRRRKPPEGPDATARLMAAAEAAGYRLDELTASLAGPRGASRTTARPKTAKRASASTARIKGAPKAPPASKRPRS